jgi:hypothetical protein
MFHDQISAGRGFSIVGARLQENIQYSFGKQVFVLYGVDGVHLGMGTPIWAGISFTNNLSVMHNHTTYHRVRCCAAQPFFAQFYASEDVFLVYLHPTKIEQ